MPKPFTYRANGLTISRRRLLLNWQTSRGCYGRATIGSRRQPLEQLDPIPERVFDVGLFYLWPYFDFSAAACSCNALNCACCASSGGTPSSSLSESEINVRL